MMSCQTVERSVTTPAQQIRVPTTQTRSMSNPSGVRGTNETVAIMTTTAILSMVKKRILFLPWLTPAHIKLEIFAKPCAAASAATAQSSMVSSTAPEKSRFVSTPTTPPSIAPIIIGRNAHAMSSRL